MAASILSNSQPFHLQSDPGVHWNANASSSLPGGRTMGIKRHASAPIERTANSLPQSYDAATGGRSTVNYDAVYGQ